MDEDDELMSRLQQGEMTAFDEIVKRHYDPLRHFFELRSPTIRCRQLSDDLAQDVLLKVYNEAAGFIPQGKFRAWMYRIARNLLIDTIRRESYDALLGARQGGDSEDQLAQLPGANREVVDQCDTREINDLVGILLAELPEEQRLTFTTYHYLGLSLPEVAEVMETSTATTKSRLRLAREKLREKLALRGLDMSFGVPAEPNES